MQWLPQIADHQAAPGVRRVLVGLLGQGIGASRTPAMHMAEGAAQGLSYDYHLIDTAGCDPQPALDEVLDTLAAAGFDGLNVTYPYKQAIIPHLSSLSPEAQAVGAVNTVVFDGGRRIGHNTDYWGFAESFRRGLPDAPRDAVLLIGAGGAGGAVAAALLGSDVAHLMIHDAHPQAATRLATLLNDRFGAGRASVVTDLATAAVQADGLVNATPVGMAKTPGLPLPAPMINGRHWVADIVYFPLETAFLATARARGCAVLPGSGMALFQAVRAFALFTGLAADPARMQATFDGFDAADGSGAAAAAASGKGAVA